MTIMSRYVLLYFARLLSLCCAAFIGIYLLIDFFEKIDDFLDYGASASDYLSYFGNNVPFIFPQILPLAMLTAVVLTLGGLGRSNEITAMRACGISLWKIVRPLMSLALILSFLLLLLNEFVVPWNTKQLNELLKIKLKGKKHLKLTHQELWYRQGNRIINIALAKPQQKNLQGVTIFTFNEDQRLILREDATTAQFNGETWIATEVTRRSFDSGSGDMTKSEHLIDQAINPGRTPAEFSNRQERNNELNIQQLSALADKLEREGYDATHQRVDMHSRVAAPFTCLIMAFLGVPFALQRGRNSNIALGIGLSLGVGVAYFIIQSMVTAFGYSAALPPIFAAWTANIIFMMLAVWLLLNVKE